VLGDATVDGREEEFVLREGDLGCISTSLQVDALQIRRAVIEDNLGGKVKETGCLGAKLVGNQRK